MEIYRPLRLILFIFDLIRLLVMISLLTLFVPMGSGDGKVFPYLFYAVPNGLFPLITLFLWLRLSYYQSYIALYMAGKILAVVAVFTWLVFSIPGIDQVLPVDVPGTFAVTAGATLLLALGDALTVLGGVILKKRLLDADAEAPQEKALPGEAPEEGI
jgi:hypothetical protein